MQLPLEISFRNMEHSDFVEARVRKEAEKLDRFFAHINSCRVVIEAPHRQHSKGNLYSVAIHITVPPGNTIDIDHVGRRNPAHEDIYVATRDAFRAAARKLEDYAARLSGRVKVHEPPPHGRVLRLFPDQGYGFLALADGREIYFHRNAVVNGGFAGLEEGSSVRVEVAEGESPHGPQASTVVPLGKRHILA